MNSRYYYVTCQVGAEKAVKNEVLDEFSHLRFAFSRPGFVTFKEDDDRHPPIEQASGVFIRIWGISLGQAKSESDLDELIRQVPEKAKFHAFERDTFVPGDEPDDFVQNRHAQSLMQKFKREWNTPPRSGEWVYDLIWIDDFHVHLGKHRHSEWVDSAPGNIPSITLPKEVPSRAYLKIEEAIHRFRPEIKKGMQVLEVGCSPGGASTAMLNRGLKVTGVDPKRMNERVYLHSNFNFIQKMAQQVTTTDLKTINPDWIVMDMNIAPLEAIDELGHVIQCLKKNFGKTLLLNRGFLTIKLNDWKFAENIPLYLRRLEELGFYDMIATQLCSNRQEFFVYASFE